MEADDETIADKVEAAMELQREIEELRQRGREDVELKKALNALTTDITRLRELSFYGKPSSSSMLLLSWHHKYLEERRVWRR